MQIAAVSGGLNRPSSTRLLADRLTEAVRREFADEREVEVAVVELRELAVDIAHNLVTGFPGPKLRAALDTVTGADALVAVTPIFAASYSGLFKSFFDVVEPGALTGMPVLIAATGGTRRHSLALEHAMRPLFAHLRTLVAPTAVFAAPEDWGDGADDADLPARIARAAGELAMLVRHRPPSARPTGDPADGLVPFEEYLSDLRRS
ncbi:FMN reductase [Thermostaphylospora chromogena]|uniref:FMN reductase n=1 Tax=Thermostaphylospora chromogena TaxID=35622 RepID=A0A1H1HFY2_9ACTN|nr:FMN reductase [Thermostaphylospora chromogena]